MRLGLPGSDVGLFPATRSGLYRRGSLCRPGHWTSDSRNCGAGASCAPRAAGCGWRAWDSGSPMAVVVRPDGPSRLSARLGNCCRLMPPSAALSRGTSGRVFCNECGYRGGTMLSPRQLPAYVWRGTTGRTLRLMPCLLAGVWLDGGCGFQSRPV